MAEVFPCDLFHSKIYSDHQSYKTYWVLTMLKLVVREEEFSV